MEARGTKIWLCRWENWCNVYGETAPHAMENSLKNPFPKETSVLWYRWFLTGGKKDEEDNEWKSRERADNRWRKSWGSVEATSENNEWKVCLVRSEPSSVKKTKNTGVTVSRNFQNKQRQHISNVLWISESHKVGPWWMIIMKKSLEPESWCSAF